MSIKISNDQMKGVSKTISKIITSYNVALREFLDNSISVLSESDEKRIELNFIEQADNNIKVIVKDSGPGMDNPKECMRFGTVNNKSNSFLNRYNSGLKTALTAFGSPKEEWRILTRTKEDATNNSYKVIGPPYMLHETEVITETEQSWPGIASTGTIIETNVERSIFDQTLGLIKSKSTSNNYPKNNKFLKAIDVIYEQIGHYYGKLIERDALEIKVAYKEKDGELIYPDIPGLEKTDKNKGLVTPVSFIKKYKYDFNNTNHYDNNVLTIDYDVYIIEPNDKRIPFDNNTTFTCYRGNESTSGGEIYFNNRLMEEGLHEDVFGRVLDNHDNKVIVQIFLNSTNKDSFPDSSIDKSKIKRDEKFVKIFNDVKSQMKFKTPASIEIHNAILEMVNNYMKSKGLYSEMNYVIRIDNYNSSFIYDLFVKNNDFDCIYDVKTGTLRKDDVYQLRSYVDIYKKEINNKIPRVYFICIDSSKVSNEIENTIAYFNDISDYEIEIKYLSDFNISFEEANDKAFEKRNFIKLIK